MFPLNYHYLILTTTEINIIPISVFWLNIKEQCKNESYPPIPGNQKIIIFDIFLIEGLALIILSSIITSIYNTRRPYLYWFIFNNWNNMAFI